MIRVVAHKKLFLTNEEFRTYDKICKEYEIHGGKDLFLDHFESNDEGIILNVNPPTKRFSSMEIFCFLLSIMQNQHMRILYEQQKSLISETENKINELIKKVDKIAE